MATLKERLAKRKVGRLKAIAAGLESGEAEGALFTKKHRAEVEEAKKLLKKKKR